MKMRKQWMRGTENQNWGKKVRMIHQEFKELKLKKQIITENRQKDDKERNEQTD
jgi:hypothetical protein